jgi:hypothetical protein
MADDDNKPLTAKLMRVNKTIDNIIREFEHGYTRHAPLNPVNVRSWWMWAWMLPDEVLKIAAQVHEAKSEHEQEKEKEKAKQEKVTTGMPEDVAPLADMGERAAREFQDSVSDTELSRKVPLAPHLQEREKS